MPGRLATGGRCQAEPRVGADVVPDDALTAFVNVAAPDEEATEVTPKTFDRPRLVKYVLGLVFGLVHGLGFSAFLRVMLGGGRDLFLPLLSFNVGLEIAQIVVAGAVVGAGWILCERLNLGAGQLAAFVCGRCVVAATDQRSRGQIGW